MSENKPNIVTGEEPTKQTVIVSWDEWQAIQKHMGKVRGRKFGPYVLQLIRQDMGRIPQVNDASIKTPSSDSQVASVFDRVTLQDRKLEEIADVLGRVTDALADLGAKIEQHQRPARPTLTKTKRAKAG